VRINAFRYNLITRRECAGKTLTAQQQQQKPTPKSHTFRFKLTFISIQHLKLNCRLLNRNKQLILLFHGSQSRCAKSASLQNTHLQKQRMSCNVDTPLSQLTATFTGYPEHMAVVNDSIEELDIALAADDGDCNVEHHSGDTPLTLAIRLHRMQIIEHLLAIGANMNLETTRFETAEVAAQCGNERIMTMLIEAGANLHHHSSVFNTNLCHFATENTDAGVMRLLVEAGAPADEPNSFIGPPIDSAASNKNEQIMSILLAAGCSVQSSRCILEATRNSNHKVLAMLIAAGADISVCDYGGFAPIHYAARNPNVAVVRLLLDAGVDVNVLDDYGENAIFKACENPNMEVLDALLAAGVEWREVASRRTICHAVAKNTNAAIVQRVIERGVNVNALDSSKRTPVMIAAQESTAAVVSLRAGADVQTTDRLCGIACGNKNAGVMRLLIAAGAPFNVDTLSRAILLSNIDAVQALIDAGMNVAQEVNANPQLLYDNTFGHPREFLEFLVRCGVDFRVFVDKLPLDRSFIVSTPLLTLLFALGADLNAKFPDERRPIETGARDTTATLVALGLDPSMADQIGFSEDERCYVSFVGENIVPHRHVAWACARVAQRQFELIKMRALQVCVGLQAFRLPALVTCEILSNAFAPLESLVAFHRVWAIVTTIKHFRERRAAHEQDQIAPT
jgi:ankyrin repeat protein